MNVQDQLLQLVSQLSNQQGSSQTTQEILTKLKFIGMIQVGEKIDVRNQRIESNNIFTPMIRMIYGQGRDATYNYIFSIVEQGFALFYSLAASNKVSDTIVCANILQDMKKAMKGVSNMQETYRDDKMFSCELETLIVAIEAKIIEASRKYPDIYHLSLDTSKAYSTLYSSSPNLSESTTSTQHVPSTTTSSPPSTVTSTPASLTTVSQQQQVDESSKRKK